MAHAGALYCRPGLLTREYLAGRRRRYVRPGRLFLVLSLVLFAGFRLASEPVEMLVLDPPKDSAPSPRNEIADAIRSEGGRGVTVGDDFNLSLDDLDGPLLTPVRKRIEAFNRLTREQKSEQIFTACCATVPTL